VWQIQNKNNVQTTFKNISEYERKRERKKKHAVLSTVGIEMCCQKGKRKKTGQLREKKLSDPHHIT